MVSMTDKPKSGAGWPEETAGPPGRDWRDTFSTAADLALAGIVVTVLALPLLTAGAAVATGSTAIRHWVEHRSWPGLRELAELFRRALLPGLGATLVAVAVTVLLILDLAGLASGTVPGGTPLVVVTALLAAAAIGLAAVVVVEVGDRGARGWLASTRAAVHRAVASPWLVPAMIGTLVVPVILALLIPIVAPIALGFTLFAIHVVAVRIPDRRP